MGVLRHSHLPHHLRLSFTTITTLAFLLLIASFSAFGLNPSRQFGLGRFSNMKEEEKRGVMGRFLAAQRRSLIGPGSSPPTCRSKCGECSPCKPVHVPIQPGLAIPLEYYPEAWRCKCGNKLFMP